MTISSRDFLGIQDLPVITQFFDEARGLVGHDKGFLHAGDVWWRYGQYEPELHQFRLWFADDHLIGVGWVTSGGFNFLETHLHPTLEDAVHDAVAREILEWAVLVSKVDVQTSSTPDNPRLTAVLESYGFVEEETEMLIYLCDLNHPIPDVELPKGFQARPVLEDELEERVSVHRDAFDPSKFTLQRYARVRSMPGYRPEFDLVIVTPQREFAAFCLVWHSDGVGEFEPVGTRASWRRQGLGRAVMLEGLQRLKAAGAHAATVYSKPENRAFYESCGFVVVNRWQDYVLKRGAS
ncbi:MAG: GNAT family N-acetyltransferase [Pleurocapsa sp. SU_196_0]|nr:GNAT family N-acetyltransferase [Pleurocapsa sp. SU_196_0]